MNTFQNFPKCSTTARVWAVVSRGKSSTITTNSKNEGTSKNFSIQERERIKPQDILQFDVGYFCGILVEGSNKEFNTRFKNISCEPVSMPERNFLFDVESILGLSMHRLRSLFSKKYPKKFTLRQYTGFPLSDNWLDF
jgi:hypothetical protein